ncbi:MAG TPA: type II CAAX endopeptidase family protein [Acidimicrobiales bacterium]
MARRQRAGTVLLDDDWSAVWRCECGYGNAGRDRCLMCGADAPTELEGSDGLYGELDVLPRIPHASDARAGRKAIRTVYKLILLNLLSQAIVAGFLYANNVETATAIKVSMISGLLCFALAAGWVLLRSAELGIRPHTGLRGPNAERSRATALRGAAEGFIVGGAVAIVLFGFMRITMGRTVLDPTTALLAVQGSPLSFLLGFLLIVIAAPVVEEFVFRGFLAEALRERGRRPAIWLSAVAFSVAHLRFSQFRYYVAMGILFALIYWRRGLVGSITAHATFNGMLLLIAVAASHGPAQEATGAGSTVSVPATYHVSEGQSGEELTMAGPLGAQIEFGYLDIEGLPAIDVVASDLARGSVPFPGEFVVETDSVVVMNLPSGPVVSMMVTIEGENGRMILRPDDDRLWMVVFRSDGTTRSFDEFEAMLESWRPAPGF